MRAGRRTGGSAWTAGSGWRPAVSPSVRGRAGPHSWPGAAACRASLSRLARWTAVKPGRAGWSATVGARPATTEAGQRDKHQ